MTARLVVIARAPATGKTTVAIALGQALSLPVITKDVVKASLADPFAKGDRECTWMRPSPRNADESKFLVDIGAPSLLVNTTDGYDPELDRIVAFARMPAVSIR